MAKIKLNKKFSLNVKKLLSSKEGKRILKTAVDEGLDRAGLYAQGEAVQLAPVKTGTLRRGIQIKREFTPRKSRVIVGVNSKTIPYAAVQEFGATITPKNKKVLAFKVNGRMVFAKKVRIPAKPYIRPTADVMRKGKLMEILTDSINRVIK